MPLSEHILTVIQPFSHAQSVNEPNFARYLRLMKFKLSPIIGLAFIIQSQADAKDIYVATDGNDLSSGAVGRSVWKYPACGGCCPCRRYDFYPGW